MARGSAAETGGRDAPAFEIVRASGLRRERGARARRRARTATCDSIVVGLFLPSWGGARRDHVKRRRTKVTA